MTDIIERLKEPEAHYPGNFDTPKRANAMLSCLCQEAAEEIERLRQQIAGRSQPGSLRGGRAMCEYVIVGGEFCSLNPGECNLQEGAKPAAANGVQADAMEDDGGSRAGTCDY